MSSKFGYHANTVVVALQLFCIAAVLLHLRLLKLSLSFLGLRAKHLGRFKGECVCVCVVGGGGLGCEFRFLRL